MSRFFVYEIFLWDFRDRETGHRLLSQAQNSLNAGFKWRYFRHGFPRASPRAHTFCKDVFSREEPHGLVFREKNFPRKLPKVFWIQGPYLFLEEGSNILLREHNFLRAESYSQQRQLFINGCLSLFWIFSNHQVIRYFFPYLDLIP